MAEKLDCRYLISRTDDDIHGHYTWILLRFPNFEAFDKSLSEWALNLSIASRSIQDPDRRGRGRVVIRPQYHSVVHLISPYISPEFSRHWILRNQGLDYMLEDGALDSPEPSWVNEKGSIELRNLELEATVDCPFTRLISTGCVNASLVEVNLHLNVGGSVPRRTEVSIRLCDRDNYRRTFSLDMTLNFLRKGRNFREK